MRRRRPILPTMAWARRWCWGSFYDNRVTLAHVGDSRIYRLRDDLLELLTRDDSLLREQVELGMIAAADARGSHNRNLVTRALGIDRQVSAHVREEDARPGDVFLFVQTASTTWWRTPTSSSS